MARAARLKSRPRLVVLGTAAGVAVMTAATQAGAGAGAVASRPGPAQVPNQVHIESVSAPVVLTLPGGGAPAVVAGRSAMSAGGSSAAPAPVAAPATPAATPAPAPAPPAPAPVPAPVAATPASDSPGGADLGTFMVTCYDLHGTTADGDQAGPESVAVDPSVIPLGTRIWIQGVGVRTADDTGGSVHGNHIDIWEPSEGQCTAFGRQYLDVHRVS